MRDAVDVDIVSSEIGVLVAERASLGVASGCGIRASRYTVTLCDELHILTRVGLGHGE